MIFNSSTERFFFYSIPTILFSLLPFFLISGPFLSDLSISLISVLFLIYCVRNKNFSYFKNKYFYFFLIFWGYLLTNSLINNFNLDSTKISFFYFRYGVFVVAISVLLDNDYKFIKYFFYCIFICFTGLILDGFYQYFNGENIFGFKSGSTHRISSFFHDELILGSYLSRLWPIFFGLSIIIFKQKNKYFSFFILIFILSEVLIFLSGDRSAFFYLNLTTIFVLICSKNLAKLRIIILLFSVSLLIIISFIDPTAKERVFDQTLTQMNLLDKANEVTKNQKVDKKNQENQIYIFSQEHHQIYTSAYKMFLDNKFLGVGIKNFRNFCSKPKYFVNKKEFCFTHPHNTYLQILSETGIIGFLFLGVILIYFCTYVFRHLLLKLNHKYYFTDFEICILSGVLIYLWPIVPTGSIFNNWLNILMILNIPFLIWSRKFNKI